MLNTSEPFISNYLDSIRTGEVLLPVPLLEGIIQVEGPSRDKDEMAGLIVSRDDLGKVVVRLAADKPLQFELVVSSLVDGKNSIKRQPVFEEPINELTLSPTEPVPYPRTWTASGEGLTIIDIVRFRTVADRIAAVTYHKQEAARVRKVETRPSI